MGFKDRVFEAGRAFFTREGKGLTLNEAVSEMLGGLRAPSGCDIEQYSDVGSANQYRSWVYVAASHNADAVSSGVLGAYSTRKARVSRTRPLGGMERRSLSGAIGKALPQTVEELLDHPIVELLNKPNTYDSRGSFLFKVDLFLELTGDAYILVERGGPGGRIPKAMHVLYSQFITIMTDGANQVVKYCYGIPRDGKFEYTYDPEEIIHIKFFDPADPLYGISPLQACFRGVGLINSMGTYEEALNQNMGLPAGVLKYKAKVIQDETRSQIEQRWHAKFAGVGKAGKVVVTDQDVDYESIGISPRDMVFMEGRRWSREEILACYRVPMAMLLTEGVNRSNMEIAQENYHRWTVAPRRKLISEGLTRGLLRGTLAEGDVILAFEDDSPIDHMQLMAKAKLLAEARALTRNELRALVRMGLEDMPDGEEVVGLEAAQADARSRSKPTGGNGARSASAAAQDDDNTEDN